VKITIDNKQSVASWLRTQEENAKAVAQAMTIAGQETATEIEQRGRQDIAGAGNFGSKWTEGFKSAVAPGGDKVTVKTTMSGPRWKIFQTGGTVKGRPLLWIPLSSGGAPKSPKNYGGQLVRVDRKAGAPLLIDPKSGPKYHGQTSVDIPKKFHLTEIANEVGGKIGERYNAALKRLTHG
jgi:hypothetical protein